MELCLPKLLNPLLNPNSKHRSQDTWLLCPEPSAGAGDHRCCKWRVGRWQGCCLDELHQGWILSIRNMFRSNDYYLCIINFHFLFKAKKICIVLISCIVPCTSYLGSGENILPWCQQWASDTAKVGSDPILTYLYSPPGWPARGRDARCASAATISIGVLIAARCVASSPLLRRISGISPVSAAAILWYHRPGKVININPVWHPSSLRLDVPIISFIWHLLHRVYYVV